MEKQLQQLALDKKMQYILANVLRISVLMSTLVIVLGGVLLLYAKGNTLVVVGVFKPQEALYVSLPAILKGLQVGNPLAIIQFGVLLLIFTPILRVIFAVLGFIHQKDLQYVAIGLFILVVIFLSSYFEVVH